MQQFGYLRRLLQAGRPVSTIQNSGEGWGVGGGEANTALGFASYCISLLTHPTPPPLIPLLCATFYMHTHDGALTITYSIVINSVNTYMQAP